MTGKPPRSDGISETMSIVLILILVVTLGAVVFAIFSGSLSPYFQKTSLVAASGSAALVAIDPTTSFPVFEITPMAGEPFYLTGQQGIPTGAPSASFLLISPDGTSSAAELADYAGSSGIYGKPLYIYRDMRGGGYWITDSIQSSSRKKYILPLADGSWKVKMIDITADTVLNDLEIPVYGSWSSTNPLGPASLWTNLSNTTWTNASGFPIPYSNNGVIPFVGPDGLQMFRFNGTGAYIRGDDNPDLDYTGDLSLSFWLQPTPAGVNGYHHLVGKGQAGDTNENFDMFIINQRLYFEWTDRTTNTIYHIMTTNTMPWGSPPDLSYVTMTISGGTPSIYFAGNPVPFGYYQSNNPGSNPVAPVSVNLKDNNNPVTIGKQNYPGNEMYYAGSMSEVSFYNRALTSAEVADNLASHRT